MSVDLVKKTFMLRRVSMFGRHGAMSFPMHLRKRIALWDDMPRAFRPHVQDAFPLLDADRREFLLTGMTPEEWNEVMGPEEE